MSHFGISTPCEAPVLLLAEPDPRLRTRLVQALRILPCRAIEARDGVDAWQAYQRNRPDAILATPNLPELSGIELLHRIRRQAAVPFAFHSESANTKAIVEAIRAGADEFFVLRGDLNTISEQLRSFIEQYVHASPRSLVDRWIIGNTSEMRRLKRKLVGISSLPVPILVSGENGTGRDHVANTLASIQRAEGERLITVAASRPPQPSDAGSTVYLDDVHRFDPSDQERWWQLVSSRLTAPKCPRRIIASTTIDLNAAAESGSFHRSLANYFSRFVIRIPPLRSRKADIGPLSQHLARLTASHLGRAVPQVGPSAVSELRAASPWPGNVKQLHHLLEQLVVYTPAAVIKRRDVRAVMSESPFGIEGMRRSAQQRMRQELVSLLLETGGNVSEVARRLGMSRGAIIYRAQKFGLLPRRRRLADQTEPTAKARR